MVTRKFFRPRLPAVPRQLVSIAAGDLRWMNVQLNWLLDLKATVDAVRDSNGKLEATPPPVPRLPADALKDGDLTLTAWRTAQESAHV